MHSYLQGQVMPSKEFIEVKAGGKKASSSVTWASLSSSAEGQVEFSTDQFPLILLTAFGPSSSESWAVPSWP